MRGMFGSSSVSVVMSVSQLISCILVLCCMVWPPSTLGRPRNKDGLESQEPECEPRSVCGYIQLNDNGPNVQTLCRCRYGVFCPLEWDIYDGHTILHGNDQYKFCERVLPLPRCSMTEPAYTSYLEMSFLSEATLVNTARLHCICPGDHLLLRNDSQFRQYDDGIATISTTYLCLPAPLCESDSTCSAITSNFRDKTTFTTRHCACPDGSFCPSHPALAKDRVDLDKGSYYIMSCLQMI